MMSKITIALAAAAIFGAASAAQANEPRDEYGGYKYGPMGQRMGTTSHWRRHNAPFFGFAFVPGHPRIWHREHDRRW
jgi:hypothetical protein